MHKAGFGGNTNKSNQHELEGNKWSTQCRKMSQGNLSAPNAVSCLVSTGTKETVPRVITTVPIPAAGQWMFPTKTIKPGQCSNGRYLVPFV